MNLISLLIVFFLLLVDLFLHADCKILRIRNHYVGRFVLVDSDLRLKSNFIRNITKYTTPQECSFECIKDNKCISINRHRVLGFCELLAISKFNDTNLLHRDLNWVHYETDDDEDTVGRLCNDLSPCQPYEVCEMTFECDPAFICRCRDGFTGLKCEKYIGPGTDILNPAASCRLLMLKHRSVPDGDYWFKGQNEKIRCERRVDGGYTKWSPYSPCNYYPCGGDGQQTRNRSCTNPTPKGGGSSCHRIGPNFEVKQCHEKCPDCSSKLFFNETHSMSRDNHIKTFRKILKEYRVEFEMRVDAVEKLLQKGIYYNEFHFTFGPDADKFGARQPALWLIKQAYIQMTFITGINDNHNYAHHERGDPTLFQSWIHIVMSQEKIKEDYLFRIHINGKEVHKKHNTNPRDYDNMKLYLSDPWYPTTFGAIKNMYLVGIC